LKTLVVSRFIREHICRGFKLDRSEFPKFAPEFHAFARPRTGKDTAASQIDEQIVKKFDKAFNNGAAAAVAALYTEDAVQVTPQGPVFGREAIEKLFTGMFQQGHFSDHLNKDDQDSPHMIGTAGNEVWRTGEWSFTVQGKSGDPIKLKGTGQRLMCVRATLGRFKC